MRWKKGDKVRVREPLRSMMERYQYPGIVYEITNDEYWVVHEKTVAVAMDYGPQPADYHPSEWSFLGEWIRYQIIYFNEDELEPEVRAALV